MKDTVDQIAASAPEVFVSSEITDIDGLLSKKVELQVYRTVQEALSNVVKHAEATAAKVTISQGAAFVNVLVQDNGKGFDYELAVARSRSLGLRTMFERITSTGGKFSIKSTPGTGLRQRKVTGKKRWFSIWLSVNHPCLVVKLN